MTSPFILGPMDGKGHKMTLEKAIFCNCGVKEKIFEETSTLKSISKLAGKITFFPFLDKMLEVGTNKRKQEETV